MKKKYPLIRIACVGLFILSIVSCSSDPEPVNNEAPVPEIVYAITKKTDEDKTVTDYSYNTDKLITQKITKSKNHEIKTVYSYEGTKLIGAVNSMIDFDELGTETYNSTTTYTYIYDGNNISEELIENSMKSPSFNYGYKSKNTFEYDGSGFLTKQTHYYYDDATSAYGFSSETRITGRDGNSNITSFENWGIEKAESKETLVKLSLTSQTFAEEKNYFVANYTGAYKKILVTEEYQNNAPSTSAFTPEQGNEWEYATKTEYKNTVEEGKVKVVSIIYTEIVAAYSYTSGYSLEYIQL